MAIMNDLYTKLGTNPSFTSSGLGQIVGDGMFGNFSDEYLLERDRNLTWLREDTSTQRQVEDYRRAGLNPWLALSGSGASSTPVTSGAETIEKRNQSLKTLMAMFLGIFGAALGLARLGK